MNFYSSVFNVFMLHKSALGLSVMFLPFSFLGYHNLGKMIKLFKVKEKQREIAENAKGKAPVKKQSAGELRLHKGFLIYIFW